MKAPLCLGGASQTNVRTTQINDSCTGALQPGDAKSTQRSGANQPLLSVLPNPLDCM
jgi:hypothetical protein